MGKFLNENQGNVSLVLKLMIAVCVGVFLGSCSGTPRHDIHETDQEYLNDYGTDRTKKSHVDSLVRSNYINLSTYLDSKKPALAKPLIDANCVLDTTEAGIIFCNYYLSRYYCDICQFDSALSRLDKTIELTSDSNNPSGIEAELLYQQRDYILFETKD